MLQQKQRIVVKALEISDEYASEILETALDSDPQWFTIKERHAAEDGGIMSAVIEEDDQDTATKPGQHLVTREQIKEAVQKVFDPTAKYCGNDRIRNDIAQDNIDAESADVVLQVALFGEVVYG